MKKIHYKLFVDDVDDVQDDNILTSGVISVSKALKNHSLAWVEKEEKCAREFFYHGNVNNIFFDFSFEAIAEYRESASGKMIPYYINAFGGDYFEVDVSFEKHVPNTSTITKRFTGWAEITLEQ